MDSKDFISVLAVIICIVALVNFSVTIIKIARFNEAVTGYASGYVNVTVPQNIAINISRMQINWGPGTINTTDGCRNATLWTRGDADPVVDCGNFTRTGGPKGIVIQNLGSVNFSLNVSSAMNATDFFGGSTASYQFNFSEKEIGTCNTANNRSEITSAGLAGHHPPQDLFFEVNKSVVYSACRQFGFITNNEMYLDVYLRIPDNNNITDGTMRRDTITLNAFAAP